MEFMGNLLLTPQCKVLSTSDSEWFYVKHRFYMWFLFSDATKVTPLCSNFQLKLSFQNCFGQNADKIVSPKIGLKFWALLTAQFSVHGHHLWLAQLQSWMKHVWMSPCPYSNFGLLELLFRTGQCDTTWKSYVISKLNGGKGSSCVPIHSNHYDQEWSAWKCRIFARVSSCSSYIQ